MFERLPADGHGVGPVIKTLQLFSITASCFQHLMRRYLLVVQFDRVLQSGQLDDQ